MTQPVLWDFPEEEKPPPAAPEPQPFHTPLPEWLWARLGELNPARASALAILEPCAWCREPTLRAQDGNVQGAIRVRVDPRLLDAGAELGEVLAGRMTAELWPSHGARPPQVFTRDQWRIQEAPGTTRRLVVPVHLCGQKVGVALPWELIYPYVYRMTQSHGLAEPPY